MTRQTTATTPTLLPLRLSGRLLRFRPRLQLGLRGSRRASSSTPRPVRRRCRRLPVSLPLPLLRRLLPLPRVVVTIGAFPARVSSPCHLMRALPRRPWLTSRSRFVVAAPSLFPASVATLLPLARRRTTSLRCSSLRRLPLRLRLAVVISRARSFKIRQVRTTSPSPLLRCNCTIAP